MKNRRAGTPKRNARKSSDMSPPDKKTPSRQSPSKRVKERNLKDFFVKGVENIRLDEEKSEKKNIDKGMRIGDLVSERSEVDSQASSISKDEVLTGMTIEESEKVSMMNKDKTEEEDDGGSEQQYQNEEYENITNGKEGNDKWEIEERRKGKDKRIDMGSKEEEVVNKDDDMSIEEEKEGNEDKMSVDKEEEEKETDKEKLYDSDEEMDENGKKEGMEEEQDERDIETTSVDDDEEDEEKEWDEEEEIERDKSREENRKRMEKKDGNKKQMEDEKKMDIDEEEGGGTGDEEEKIGEMNRDGKENNKQDGKEGKEPETFNETENSKGDENKRKKKKKKDKKKSNKNNRNDKSGKKDGTKKKKHNKEEEDETNTVCSMETFGKTSKKDVDKIRPPESIRYTFQFNLLEPDLKNLEKEFKKKGVPKEKTDTLLRMREILIELLKVAHEVDDSVDLVPWLDEDGCKLLGTKKGEESKMTKTAAILNTYFSGLQPNKIGRKWVKLRLHASNFSLVEKTLQKWARSEQFSFSRCIVQAEKECVIGWLVYSSQFTNTDHLGKLFKKKTQHEWGFRLGAITESDVYKDEKKKEKTLWKDRKKAIFVHVPLENNLTATQFIGELLEPPNFFSPNRVPQVTDRLLFTPPEKAMSSTDEEALKYRRLVEKQDDYNQELVAHLEVDIKVDIDKKVYTKAGRLLTLREMILLIKVHKTGETKGMSLFQSIDFTPNASRLYFNGRQGPGCAGHVFSFYKLVEQEAIQMIRGLGIYLLRIYGSLGIRECFSNSYWKGLKGWKWSKTYECFDRPESRQLHSNVCHDPNQIAGLLEKKRLEKKKIEELKKKKAEEKDKEESNNAEERMKKQLGEDGKNKGKDEEEIEKEMEKEVTDDEELNEEIEEEIDKESEKDESEEKDSSTIEDTSKEEEKERKKRDLRNQGKEENEGEEDLREEVSGESMETMSQITSVSDLLRKNKIEQMKKREDQDLESEGGERVVNEIIHDDVSVTSSLTAGTNEQFETDDDMSEGSSIVSLDSMETFGAETTDRAKGSSNSIRSGKKLNFTKEFFKKMWKPGMTSETAKQQATQYIQKCATRAFQESTAAYQAAFDEIMKAKEKEEEERNNQDKGDEASSVYSFISTSTNKTDNVHRRPTGSYNTGREK